MKLAPFMAELATIVKERIAEKLDPLNKRVAVLERRAIEEISKDARLDERLKALERVVLK